MPTSLIPIIARTNTIDEWRIQTNKSATDLNDLWYYVYTKANGEMVFENTSILSITSEGTPLQVANNVLFQNDLTLANNLFLGTQSSAKGNIISGGTISILGPGRSLNVANVARIGSNLEVVNTIYTSNVYANTDIDIGRDLTVDRTLNLTGTGNVFFANVGTVSVNTMTAKTITSANVLTPNLYADVATIVVLNPLAFATIVTLENTTANSYYLSSNTIGANTITVKEITSNVHANIANLLSNVSILNTSTLLDTTIGNSHTTNAIVELANVVTISSNVATINNESVGNSTITLSTIYTANVINLTSNIAEINTLSINAATINVSTTNIANVVYLYSPHLIEANTISVTNVETSTINVETVNVESDIFVQSGGKVRVYAPDEDYESVTLDGKTTLEKVVVTDDLTVSGVFTQLGEAKFSVDTFTLNADTATNTDASLRNQRPIGDDSYIKWDETDDIWKISRGNVYASLYGILDASLLDSTVTSLTTGNVATPMAVNTAHYVAQTAGSYANSAYLHANSAHIRANTNYTNAVTKLRITTDGLDENFLIDQYRGNDPTIYVKAGETIAFDLNITGHQFVIRSSQAGTNYNTGLTHVSPLGVVTTGSSAQGKEEGVLYWKVPFELASNTYYYECSTHPAMSGAIVITPDAYSVASNTQFARDHANASYETANLKFNTSGGTITGDTTISQSLTVSVNTTLGAGATDRTWIKSKHLYISDNIITLNAAVDQTLAGTSNVGFEIDRGSQSNVFFIWDETSDSFRFTTGVITNDPDSDHDGLLEVPVLGAKSGEEYANAAFSQANAAYVYTATVEATLTNPGGFSERVLTLEEDRAAASSYANGSFEASNSVSSYANSSFDTANNKLDLSGAFISEPKEGLQTVLTPGTNLVTLTLGNTTGLYPGMPLLKVSGTGEFSPGATVLTVTGAATFTTSLNHQTAGAIGFKALGGVNAPVSQTVAGSVSFTGKVETANMTFGGTTTGTLSDTELYLNGSKIRFNSNHPTNSQASRNASIEVQRDSTNFAVFRWKENGNGGEWQYSNATGSAFYPLGGVAASASSIESDNSHTVSDAANRLLVQTGLDQTGFTPAAPANLERYLRWTGSAFEWTTLSFFDGSALNADNLSSGKIPVDEARWQTGNVPGTTQKYQYPINISGFAATATSATSASTAGTAYNVRKLGPDATGSIVTNSIECTTFKSTSTSGTPFEVSGAASFSKSITCSGITSNDDGDFKSNDVYAGYFYGTATAAQYSDLAEAYVADENYPIGTIVMIGGENEITAATLKGINSIIGAVSDKPAFLMNSKIMKDGTENALPIALKGRIPLRILGKCKKGDVLSLSKIPGVATVSKAKTTQMPIRFIALENKDYIEEGHIEVAVM